MWEAYPKAHEWAIDELVQTWIILAGRSLRMRADTLLQRLTLQPRIVVATQPHRESWHEFHVIAAGAGEFHYRSGAQQRGGVIHCRPGDVFYTPAGLTHHMQAAQPQGYVLQYVAWLPVSGELARDLRSHFPLGSVKHLPLDQHKQVRDLAEQHARGDGFSQRAATRGFVGLLYRLMSDEALASDVPASVAAMLVCIHGALRRPLTLAEVAKAAGLETTSAVRVFRRHLGMPPMTYHAGLRLDLAADLLGDADSVGAVATAIGYEDPFHFSRAFRQRFDQAPSHYLGHKRSKITPPR